MTLRPFTGSGMLSAYAGRPVPTEKRFLINQREEQFTDKL